MAQLTHEQYDALERAVVKGMRVAVYRSGRREGVFVPLALRLLGELDRMHASDHRLRPDNYLDEIDSFEVVG
jgi:hypothetical protein